MSRKAVLVLGMHRSGTSLVSGLLVHLGLRGPATLMPPNAGNPGGYWESTPLAAFHDRLLSAAATSWDGWTPIEPGWWASQSAVAHASEFRGLLDQEFASAPLLVAKDPRLCRVVPFWLRNLKAARVEPAALLVLRSPAEVARSLAVRDGFAPEQSLLMWLRHVLDAERDTRTITRSIVRYRDVLTDWRRETARVAAELAIDWPGGPAAGDAVDGFVRPELCHHDAGLADLDVGPPLFDWVAGAAAALETVASGPSADASNRLDEIRAAFDRVVVDALTWPEADLHDLRARLTGLEAERDALTIRHAQLEAHVDHVTQHAARLERHRQALLTSFSWRLTAPLRALARPLIRRRADTPPPESERDPD